MSRLPLHPWPAPALGRWANANELPTIDFAPLSGKNEAAIERVAKEVHDACRDIGFLTIVNHPVPPGQDPRDLPPVRSASSPCRWPTR